jgi:cation transport regulator ChaC
MSLLFSYGSNDPDQLATRLERPVDSYAALADGWARVFRGSSRTWGGAGVASLVRKPGTVTYGLVVPVTEEDLRVLDRYEGVPRSYRRKKIAVEVGGEPERAVAYIATSRRFNPPSREYLKAVARTISTHWRSSDGSPVVVEDITIRNNPGEHPAWWIEQLEYLETMDEPGGVRYSADTGLEPRIVHALERRGLVRTKAKLIHPSSGGYPSTVSWVELTPLGREVVEGDLPPPARVRRSKPREQYPGPQAVSYERESSEGDVGARGAPGRWSDPGRSEDERIFSPEQLSESGPAQERRQTPRRRKR